MKYVYMATWRYQSSVGLITTENWYDVHNRPFTGKVEPMIRIFEFLEDAIAFYSEFGFTFTAVNGMAVTITKPVFGERNEEVEPFFPVNSDDDDTETTTMLSNIVIERISITK